MLPKSPLARTVALVAFGLAIGLLAVVAVTFVTRDRDRVATSVDKGITGAALVGGPFGLVDQHGATRTDAEFRGRFMLIYFGYTYCPDVCPTELATMGRALDLLGDAGERVQPIFITVDPERDTVEQLATYGASFHPRLLLLTGSAEQVKAAATAYRVYSARVEGSDATDYLMDHTSIVYLMGPDGRFLTHFPQGTPPERMAEVLRERLSGA